ncbi:MAG: PKD domain-containing protein [Bacteroidetes bacterium]|jgi:PKD repeat protein|nr:PKD domain-containing protein [Bacteroidota bacterium]
MGDTKIIAVVKTSLALLFGLFITTFSNQVMGQCPTANAGVNASVCADDTYQLNGTIDFASAYFWTHNGSGNLINETTATPTYIPGGSDLDGFTVTITLFAQRPDDPTCTGTYQDQMELEIVAAPAADAGPTLEVCAGNSVVISGATAQHYSAVQWEVVAPTSGSFNNNALLNPTFTPSASDITRTFAEVILVAQGNAPCSPSDPSLLRINITPPPTAAAGSNQQSCGTAAVVISGASATNEISYAWTSSGSGSFDDATALAPVYTPSAADVVAGSVILTFTVTGDGTCGDVSDTKILTLLSGATADAGGNDESCVTSAYTFSGGQASVTNASSLLWTHNGNGSLSNATTLTPTYTPASSDAGNTITLTLTATSTAPCSNQVSDAMQLTILAEPTADAGLDVDICETTASIQVSGTASNASAVEWTTTNGTGTIQNETTLSPTYLIDAADIIRGTVRLRLEAFGQGNCGSDIDEMTIRIQQAPAAFAGADRNSCAGSSITINDATASDYDNLLWQVVNGSGTLLAGTETTLSPVYQSVLADGGTTVRLSLTAEPINGCSTDAVDYMDITVFNSPSVNLDFPAAENCETTAFDLADVNPQASNYSTLLWTSSGTGSFDNPGIPEPLYTPSAADVASGMVTLTLTADPIAPCTATASASLDLTLIEEPTASAGADQTICETGTTTINGSASNAAGILWTTSGDGTFTGADTPTPVYTPGAADIATGTAILTITVQPIAPCAVAASDMMQLTLTPAPVADAGADDVMCDGDILALNGFADNYSSFVWSSTGNGTFTPANSLTPNFTPSASEIAAGTTVITLRATGNSPCNVPVTDQATITINAGPTADAGPDRTICQTGAILNATATNYASLQWTTSGDGSFSDANTEDPIYSPGPTDIGSSVVLTLTANPNNPCAAPAVDQAIITIEAQPQVVAFPGGSDAICETTASYSLATATAINTSSVLWTTSGDGTFSNNAITNPIYYPGATDINNEFVDLTLTGYNAPCNSASSTMRLTISNNPEADAGPNQTICVDDLVVLNGATADNYNTITWSSVTGTGTFSDPNIINPIYSPSNADYLANSVTLRLTATAEAPCVGIITSDIIIYITQPPLVDVGIGSDDICEDETYTITTATASNYDALQWSSNGNGSWVNANNLVATYTPGSNDIISGSVVLRLTATPNNPCSVDEFSEFTLNIQSYPEVNAGSDREICEGEQLVITNSTAINYSSLIWNTSGSGSFDDNTLIRPVYTPSAADIASGNITLTLTATSIGSCSGTVSDDMTLTIDPDPSVSAGVDATICGNGNSHHLADASANNYTSLVWTTTGDGSFSNATNLNPTYTPGTTDISSGNVTLTLTAIKTSPCYETTSDDLILTIDPMPEANAGPDAAVCDNAVYALSGATATNASAYQWTSTGTGSFNNSNLLNPSYTPTAADVAAGSVILTLTATGSASCGADSHNDEMTLSFSLSPSVDAGPDEITCETGIIITNANALNYNQIQWISSGSSGTLLNQNTLTPTYIPSAADIVAGSVTLTLTATANTPCATAASDDLVVTILSNPTANAGIDATICETDNYLLNGTVSNHASYSWSSSGDGNFLNSNTLTPTYIPGVNDIASGSITIMLSAQSIAPCADDATDQMVLTIQQLPVVDAGPNATICENSTHTTNGSSIANGYTALVWTSSGTGNFDNPNMLNATYTPSANDINLGSVNLTLTATSTVICGNLDVSDFLTLTFAEEATADAGSSPTICSSASYTVNDATATNYSSVLWISNGDGILTNANTLTPTYSPGLTDIENGSAMLTLTANGNASCGGSATSQMIITITAPPTANAGIDGSACEGGSYQLNGTATNFSSYSWASNGTGSFVNAGTLTPTYIPDAADAASGSVIITLTAVNGAPCNETVSDQMILTVTAIPTVTAGTDATICEGNTYLTSGATATNQAGLLWSTSGTGTFTNQAILLTTYQPSAADITAGSVTLTLTASSNAPCSVNPSDSFVLTITGAAVADAGNDETTCITDQLTINSASAADYSTLNWTHNGSGTLIDAGTISPTYVPAAADALAGSVILTLNLTGNSPCGNTSDQMIITIIDGPTVNAGPDATSCSNNFYTITGFTGTNYSSISWTTTGTGTFSNPTISNPDYQASNADLLAGQVTLTATVSGIAPCSGSASDSFLLSFADAPTASAGVDVDICEGSNLTINTATATNATAYNWTSSGTGVLTNSNTLNPTYTPSANDISLGSVSLTLTVIGEANCADAVDQMVLSIIASPEADAGNDETICAGETLTISTASATNYATLSWSASGTGTLSGANSLTPSYNPSAADIISGSVTLSLQALPDAPCAVPAVSSMNLTINPAPTAFAGANATVCQPGNYTITDATATNYSTISWTSSGTGTFTNGTSLTPTYAPSAADYLSGSVTLTLTVNGSGQCAETASSSMILSLQAAPLANAGADASICEQSSYTISGATATGYNNLYWTSSGSGVIAGSNTLSPTYTPSAADITAGSVTLTLHLEGAPPCNLGDIDEMNLSIQSQPDVYAGSDAQLCDGSSYTIPDASLSNATVFSWTTNGSGTFLNPNTLSPTYVPSAGDFASGNVTITLQANSEAPCTAIVSDALTLTLYEAVSAYAGTDAAICADDSYQLLEATATNYSSLLWTSSGTGAFSNSGALNPSYTPSNADIANGNVVLSLQATGINPCNNVVTDLLTLSFDPVPTAYAGTDATVCAASYTVNDATAQNYSQLLWTSNGTGTISNANALSPTYVPSPADIANGNVVLTLTVTGAANCNYTLTDTKTLTFVEGATVNAGNNEAICSGDALTITTANATAYASLQWSSSGDGIFTDATTLIPTYTPGTNDIANGSIVLTLSAVSSLPCTNTVSDQMTLSILPNPTVFAGNDQTSCSSAGFAITGATAQNFQTLSWSGSGTGSFSNVNALNPTYYPSATDISIGSVTLLLTATSNLGCANSSDSFVLSFGQPATANAGPNASICETVDFVVTSATATNASTIQWTSSGTGTFFQQNTLTPTYYPSAQDIALGTVNLNLTVQGAAPCNQPATDQLTLTIENSPTVDAGNDAAICSTSSYTVTTASVANTSSVVWTSTGTGTLTNGNTLTPTYQPSAADITNGSVVLTLTGNPVAPCVNPIQDQMTISFTNPPLVFAGPDREECAGGNIFMGEATASSYNSILWQTNGTGYFINPALVNATYVPSAADIASGQVTLTLSAEPIAGCSGAGTVSDFSLVTFTNGVSVYAGQNGVVCDGGSYTINDATAGSFSSLIWETSGTGIFDNSTILNPTYTPSGADIIAGSVTLSLSATGSGSCAGTSDTDQMVLNVLQSASVQAGANLEVCGSNTVSLSGVTASDYFAVSWVSSGDGSFDNPTALNPNYTPGAADITNGSATLTVSVSSIPPCTGNASDNLVVIINEPPTADAGIDATICGNQTYDITTATASQAGSFTWTSTGTGFFSNPNVLNPIYTPSVADNSAGSVILTLTVSGIDGCITEQDSDNITLTILPGPEASAPADQQLCDANPYNINGATANYYSALNWVTSGTGSFDDATILNPVYTPSAADFSSGSVMLTLTASPLAPCSAATTDDFMLIFSNAPAAFAGADATIAQGDNYTIADATASNYNSLNWTTSGDGAFNDNSLLNPTYTPGPNDLINGLVTLSLEATNGTNCPIASDNLVLQLLPEPTAYAGLDDELCENQSYTLADATATDYNTLFWTTSGDGSFTDQTILNPVYTPGINDISTGSVTLTLTATCTWGCPAAVDELVLTVHALPTVFAGTNVATCQNQAVQITNAAVTGVGTMIWTHNGNGTLNNNSIIDPIYTPSVADAGNTVTLTLTVDGINGCAGNPTSDQVDIIVDPAPQANAGPNATVCVLSDYSLAAASMTDAINPTWTHNGAGSLSNTNTLNPLYSPAVADAGNAVTFTLTVEGMGNCTGDTDSDDAVVTFSASPTAYAGADKTSCSTNAVMINDASFTNGSTLLWTHNGTGSFSNSSIINPTYLPGAGDPGSLITLTLTVTGNAACNTETVVATAALTIEESPAVYAGTDKTTCTDQSIVFGDATATNTSAVSWTHNGSGSLSSNSALNPTYTPAPADAGNTITFTLSGDGTGTCSAVTEQSVMQLDVIALPAVFAGNDITSCDVSPYMLADATAADYTLISWTSSGSGTFDDPNLLNATYTPSAADVLNGSVLLTLTASPIAPCSGNAIDALVLSFEANMTVNAGSDATLCEGSIHSLNASASNFTSLLWSSSGDGVFSDNTILNPDYTPGTNDVLNGNAVLTLTASNTVCSDASDQLTLTIQGNPAVNAGTDDVVCENGAYTLANATSLNTAGLLWQGGDGFFDNPNLLNATYVPGPNDIQAGTVQLTLIGFAQAPCSGQTTDVMSLSIESLPQADAGSDVTLCDGASYIVTDASASNYSSLNWTSSGTGSIVNSNSLSPTYIPSALDVSLGTVFLTLEANPVSPCANPASSQMTITYVEGPQVDAGTNTTICETENYTNTDATASNYSSLLWVSSGSGTFTADNVLNTTYIPSANDISAGVVTLTLTAFSSGQCPDVSDQLTLSFDQAPIADAGTTSQMCIGLNPIEDAFADHYSSLQWTTTGSGTLTNANTLTPLYQATAADVSNSPISFTLTANPSAACGALPASVSTIFVDVSDNITVDAGSNATICQTDNYSIFDAAVSNSTDLLWSSSGDGIFSDPTIIDPTYIPGTADINLGFATLTLTASNASCDNVQDNMTLTINRFPVVDAGADAAVCVLGNYTVQDASVQFNYSTLVWTHNGAGTLSNINSLTPTYTPDASEIGTQITLQLTASAAAPCTGDFVDALVLSITDTPIADAGPDALICETESYTPAAAFIQNATAASWTTSGSGTFINPGDVLTTYIPSTADITAGSVTLTLEALNPPCASDADQMILSFGTLPLADAGPDATVDINTSFTIVGSAASNYQSISWSTSGTGTFDDASILNPTYTPSNQDFAMGSVQLTLTATGNMPCDTETVSDYMILTVTDHPPVDFTWDISCANMPIQFTVDQTITDITDVVSFNWNFGDGTTSNLMDPLHQFAAPGNYNVSLMIVNTGGYSNTVTKVVTIDPLPVALFSYENPVCGSQEVQFFNNSSTTAGFITSWEWDFGDGNSIIIDFPDNPNATHVYASSGIYDVSLLITTDNGCTSAVINTIEVEPAPVAAFDYTASCANNDVQFSDLSQTNGAGTIVQWQWDFGDPLSGVDNFSGQQNPTHQFSSAGNFDVQLIITASNGCSDTVVNSISVDPEPVVAITVPSGTVCLGTPLVFSATGGNIVSWFWNFGDGNTSSQANPTHLYQFAGNYTVTLDILDANGCTATATENISVNELPTANFNNTAPGCPDESIYFTDLSISPNGGISNWLWDFGDGNTVSIDAPNDPDVSHIYTNAGTYNVTLTVTDVTGCEDSFTRQVVTENGPLANFTFEQTCFGEPVLFTDLSSPNGGSDLFSWAWDFGDPLSGVNNSSTLQNPSHLFTAPGLYTVSLTVTNTQGCTNTFEADVTVTETVDIDFATDAAAFCPNEPIDFTPTGTDIVSYFWEFGDGGTSIQQTPQYIYTNPGTYTVSLTVTAIDGCQGYVEHDVVINEEPLAAFTTDSPSCSGAPTQFFNASSSPTGHITEWIWSFGDGSADVVVAFPDNPDVNHLYASDGTYNASLTVTNSNGCSNTISHEVIVAPGPIGAFDYAGTCAESPVVFTDLSQENGGGEIVSWQWDFGDLASGTSNTSLLQNPEHSFSAPGAYDVTLIITNINGCSDTVMNSITVDEALLVEITADSDTLCLGSPVTFTGTAAGAVIWNWNFGDGNSSTQQNPEHTYTQTGNFMVMLTAETPDGCSNTDTLDVVVMPNPISLFTSTSPICSTDSVYFTNQSTTPNGFIQTWIWDMDDGTIITVDAPDDPNIAYQYANPGTFEVSLTVIDNSGCENTSSRLVQVEASPIADFSYNESCLGSPVLFTDLTSTNGGSDLFGWEWYFGDPNSGINNTSTLQNPSHLFTVADTFDVTLIVTNTIGCTDTIVKELIVSELPTVDFTIDNDSICLNTAAQFTGIGENINTWFWEFGDGGTSIQQSPSYMYAEPGQYDVTLTVTAIDQCQNSISYPIFVNDAPIADFSMNNGCLGDTTYFVDETVSLNGFIEEWAWDFGDGNTSDLQNPAHFYGMADDYLVTLTATDNFGCFETISRWVSIYEKPIAAFSSNQVCDPSGKVFFFNESESSSNGSPIIEYEWNFHDGYFSNEINPNHIFPETDTCYVVSLTVTDAFGCDSTVTDTICIWEPLSVDFTATEVCQGEPTFFEASYLPEDDSIVSYAWNFSDGSDIFLTYRDTTSHTFAVAGNYFVELTATNINGCEHTIYHEVTVNGLPLPDFEYLPGLCETPAQFTDLSDGNGALVQSWFWDFGDPDSGPDNTSTLQNPTHLYSDQGGSYQVKLIVTNFNGCTDSITKEVNQDPCIQASFISPNVTLCADSTICFTENSYIAADNGNIVSWTWNFGDNTPDYVYTSEENPVCHTFAAVEGGEFIVSLTIEATVNGSPFTDTFTDTITIYPKPTARFIPQPVCQNTAALFQDNSISNGLPITSWLWDFGDLSTLNDTSSQQNPAYHYPDYGLFDVQLVVANQYDCTDTLVSEIEIYQPPTADFIAVDSCATYITYFNDLSVEGGASIASYFWHFGDPVSSDTDGNPWTDSTSTDRWAEHIYNQAGTYFTTLVIEDDNSCRDTVRHSLPVHPIPTASFIYEDRYEGKQGQVAFENTSDATASSFFWDFMTGDFSDEENPVYQFEEDGLYDVMLVAYNSHLCPDTAINQYEIIFTGLYFPNTFVPNSDDPEVNNFKGLGENLETYLLEVYTSWGQLVWTSTALEDGKPLEAWDGTYNNQDLPTGSYIWKASATFKDGTIWEGSDNGDGNLKPYGIINLIR